MKYLNHQKHNTTCGIVSIVNVCRRFGYDVTYEEVIKFHGNIKKGLTIAQVEDILISLGFEVFICRTTLEEARWFARHPDYSVAVGYCWKYKGKKGSHIVTLDHNGKALNAGKRCRLNKRRWRDSIDIWGFSPFVMIVKDK